MWIAPFAFANLSKRSLANKKLDTNGNRLFNSPFFVILKRELTLLNLGFLFNINYLVIWEMQQLPCLLRKRASRATVGSELL